MRIDRARTPSFSYLAPKHLLALEEVIPIAKFCSSAFGFDLKSIYVRGSTVLGAATANSDLDLVLLCANISVAAAERLKHCVRRLCGLSVRAVELGIKVFSVDSHQRIHPPTTVSGKEYILAMKYVNFDVYMNGICHYGIPIRPADNIYDSIEELVYANRIIWSAEIHELLSNMLGCVSTFHARAGYLSKKILRLCAYSEVIKDFVYYATVTDCRKYAIKRFPGCEASIDILYGLYMQTIHANTIGESTTYAAIKAVCDKINLSLPKCEAESD